MIRVVLASKSPARLLALRGAGLTPDVIVSGFDETTIVDSSPTRLCTRLAEAKGSLVASSLPDDDVVVLAADTVMEIEGKAHGKPRNPESATRLWHRMRGHGAVIHTGHWVCVRRGGVEQQQSRVRSTGVHFADLSDDEVAAYVATGEPIDRAGGFSINGLAGAFVTRIDGDPYNVVGISLPLVRQMVIDLGVPWHELWQPELPGTILP